MLATAAGHDPAQIPSCSSWSGSAARGDDRVRGYSFGMKQRLGIAAALLGDPSLLILDEPINGLDPAGVHEMRGLIGRLAGGERTVLVSSHVLAELEQVCDWLIVIDGGRLVFQGPAAELLDRSGASLVVAPEHPGDLDRLRGLLAAAGHDSRRRRRPPARSPSNGADPRGLAAALNRAAGGRRDRARRAARRPHQPRGPLPDDGERRRPMIRMFKAELLKLRRRRVAVAVRVGALAFAADRLDRRLPVGDGGRRAGLAARRDRRSRSGRRAAPPRRSRSGRRSSGILVLVLFIANVAGEFSQGTFRTLLMRQPRRVGAAGGQDGRAAGVRRGRAGASPSS